jgi:predicted Zn-dependent protease
MYFHVCGTPSREIAAGSIAKWPMDRVTYYESIEIPGLTRDQVAAAYDRAAQQWSEVAGVEFARVEDPAKANIVATSGPIDGAYGVLAYSELPYGAQATSVMHQMFDDSEPWSTEGFDMFVACMCHEIGHALGLEHIPNAGALMDPYIVPGRVAPQPPDIAAMRALYGPPPVLRPVPVPTPDPGDPFEALGRRFAPYVIGPFADSLVREARSIEAGDGTFMARAYAKDAADKLLSTCWESLSTPLCARLRIAQWPGALRKVAKGLADTLAH